VTVHGAVTLGSFCTSDEDRKNARLHSAPALGARRRFRFNPELCGQIVRRIPNRASPLPTLTLLIASWA
jgi:hypothetical protein